MDFQTEQNKPESEVYENATSFAALQLIHSGDLAATLKKQSVTPLTIQLSDTLTPADLSKAAAQM